MNLLHEQCSHGAHALTPDGIAALLPHVAGWTVQDGKLRRSFDFRDYHETIGFVNALAWMIHGQDHHPQLAVTYKHCVVSYSTHSAGDAISANDFICAAKANAIYAERAAA